MKIIYLVFGLTVLCSIARGQEGSSCAEPIFLDSLENSCSAVGAYNLSAQTYSGVPRPSCFPEDSGVKDMWFQFTPTFKNINIVVRGESRFGDASTLRRPQMALYKGDCSSLDVISCNSDSRGQNFIELTVGDLELGASYLIQVSSRINHNGRFQLCIDNFQFTPDNSSDCPDATVLCDKQTIKVDLLSGTGKIRDEADGTCLDTDPVTGRDDGNSESSSVWFKWIARNDGDLTFTLDPINPVDDLDFAVFELPDGLDDCKNKVTVRCMASGENVGEPFDDWKICTGATGLREGETNTDEQRGCQDGNTNFLAPLKMEAGKAYALVVNNFSQSGSGFRLEWGGEGEFAGPSARMIFLNNKPIYCTDDEIQFYAKDESISGQITKYNWVYSGQEISGELNGAGPHTLSFSSGGTKPVILSLESDIGCVTALDTFLVVEDPIKINAVIDSITCNGYGDGRIEVNVESPSMVISAIWQDGTALPLRTGLLPGDYIYFVENELGCSASAEFRLDQPLPIVIDPLLSNPTCGGGMDGQIQLNVSGTFRPFQYDFNDGLGFTDSSSRSNLFAGIYSVEVQDSKGCTEDALVLLSERDLSIDQSNIQPPRCYGSTDGSVELIVNGGRGPYQYDFGATGTFGNGNQFSGLSANSYIIAIRDQDQCTAFTDLTIDQPDSITLSIDTTHISCFGEQDGRVNVTVKGGTPGYRYQWDHGATTPGLINLQAGDYRVMILDQNNCPAEASLTLKEPLELSLSLDEKKDLVCFGDSDGEIRLTAEGGDGTFIYQLGGGSLSSDGEFTSLRAGQYNISVQDGNQCRDSIQVALIEPEQVIVHITAEEDSVQTIRLGESLVLGSSYTPSDRNMSWEWTPTERVDCADCPQVTSMSLVNTLFTLTGTDQDGCVGRDELLVNVIAVRDLGVPNVVIPSQGGQDGYVTIYGGPHIARIIKFDVFDRWGNLLFTRSDFPPNKFELGWNGTAKGKPLIPGIYVYSARVEFIDQVTKDVSGEILVIE